MGGIWLYASVLLLATVCIRGTVAQSENTYMENELEILLDESHGATHTVHHDETSHEPADSFTGSCQTEGEEESRQHLYYGPPEVTNAASINGASISFKPFQHKQFYYTECKTLETRKYRTADGTCNHMFGFGSAHTPFARLLPAVYQDGKSVPRMTGQSLVPLPSPIDASRLLIRHGNNFGDRSNMYMQWGQFTDHDVSLGGLAAESNELLRCCGPNGTVPDKLASKECLHMIVSPTDERFDRKCIETTRTNPALTKSGKEIVPREQVNDLTHFLDGSMIYGNSEEEQEELRTGDGGLMKTSHDGKLLPPSLEENSCMHEPGEFCFLAGDVRVNEQPGLAWMHTVWVLYHNKIAEKLNAPGRTDEEIFQETRKIVIASIQNIHYGEWLPIVVGESHMEAYNLYPGHRSPYLGHILPTIFNAFSTAAYRFGHSTIPEGYVIGESLLPLNTLFMKPSLLFSNFKELGKALLSASGIRNESAQSVDIHMVRAITDKLFEIEGIEGSGSDLAALNINRGRDHGLPSYNQYRKYCGLQPYKSFDEFVNYNRGGRNTALRRNLANLYGTMHNLELFPGGLIERPMPGAAVGPTFACIIAQQFHALKFGDRFFYETDTDPQRLNDEQLNGVRNITMSHVLCVADAVHKVQPAAFLVPGAVNKVDNCAVFRDQFYTTLELFV